MTDLSALRATTASLLRARGDAEAADLLERARLELVGEPQRWSVEGRSVLARRVAVWLEPADRVRVARRPELQGALREAVAAAIEAPDETLRELLVLCRRAAARAPEPGYRTSAAPEGPPDGPTIAATAAAYLDAAGALPVARALRRGEVLVEPVPGGTASGLIVRLDPADLVAVRRDAAGEASLREAIEAAYHSPSQRAAYVVLRLLHDGSEPGHDGPEERLSEAARRFGWQIVPVDRDAAGTTLALFASGRLQLVRIEPGSFDVRGTREEVPKFTLAAERLSDVDAALLTLSRIVDE